MSWQAKKSFGQHALHDKKVARKLVESMPAKDGERIVEVGPGAGALTRQLVEVYPNSKLTLIEADADLIEDLKAEFPQAEIIHADAAHFDYSKIEERWHFLSNLPYNASAAILKQIFTTHVSLQSLVIIAQKEQAQRMLARAGEMSLLSLSIQLYATGKKLFDIAPGSFNPPPNVDSRATLLIPVERSGEEEEIMELARPAFSQRRKQLRKTLGQSLGVEQMVIEAVLGDIDLKVTARPQELSIEKWRALNDQL